MTVGSVSTRWDSAYAVIPHGPTVQVVSIPLACCALEASSFCAWARRTFPQQAVSSQLSVALLSGTVTWPVVEQVRAELAALGTKVVVVAVGACASKGGPYWDAAPVVPGAQEVVGVDIMVAGCPPTPLSIWSAIVTHLTAGSSL